MMSMKWVALFVALASSYCGYGLPVRPTPQDYPHDGRAIFEGWTAEGGLYAAIPALALVITAVVLVFGCTWCYRHKDCKPNEGTDNQIFTASAQHLHAAQRVQPPDSGFSEPANNNISEDNNNGPISLREMQNIANNNAAAYIVSENEERNRISRESVVEFEPLPTAFIGDPLEHCADWFGTEDFPRNNLQYLREIGRGWFGRVVEGEIEEAGANTTVAVKILNQNATLEDKARFLGESKMYRDVRHENILAFIGKCLQEDPWILIFELCSMDLQQYLIVNRPKMAILNENGVPLRLMCDVTSALAYLHSRGYTYGQLWSGSVQVRETERDARAVLGRYSDATPPHDCVAPEVARHGARYTTSSDIWSLGSLIWEVCSWGSASTGRPSPPPDLPCPYRGHLYQVMQLCWCDDPRSRPTAAQAHALVSHLHATQAAPRDSAHFEERWQRLKPNSIPKVDEHVAIVHAHDREAIPSDRDLLSTDRDLPASRSSSVVSDRDVISAPPRSESLTNLHGSLDDVRNIYLTHNETAALDCTQGNMPEDDRTDASLDPWLKDIVAGSQDDVSYYRDVSDVIKNLDNILNSEKTSSSESSHQASPSRDNLSLDCKKEYPVQSSLVKSPGITNFQNILDTGFGADQGGPSVDDETDRDTIGTLSHSFERHSDSTSQHTLENLTPDTPMKDLSVFVEIERQMKDTQVAENESQSVTSPEDTVDVEELGEAIPKVPAEDVLDKHTSIEQDTELPKEVVNSEIPKLKELCVASMPSISDNDGSLVIKDCQSPCDNVTEIRTDNEETKSIDDVRETIAESMPLEEIEVTESLENHELIKTSEQEIILPLSSDDTTASNEGVDTLPSVTDEISSTTQENDTSHIKLEDIGPASIESEHNYSKDETILVSDLVDTITDSSKGEQLENPDEVVKVDVKVDLEPITREKTPVSVQNIIDDMQEPAGFKQIENVEAVKHVEVTPTHLPPEIVQNTDKIEPVPETDNLVRKDIVEEKIENVDNKDNEANTMHRSDSNLAVDIEERSDNTEYMDLINNTNSQILKDSTVDNSVKDVEEVISGLETTLAVNDSILSKNDSTEYLDLPSFDMIKKTDDFLHMERTICSKHFDERLVSSTPITSDTSVVTANNTVEQANDETMVMHETKVEESVPGPSAAKEQKYVADSMSPFDSPSHKSHHTDTYDENSSVVLGPFENCTPEIFKSTKANIEPVELPREELLAFSSNFSEMNLETPSPLRDGNFLNEVPDITPDDAQFDDLASISEPKVDIEVPSDDTEGSGSDTQKRVSPSTPPNSPGAFLASSSQQKYLVDIDLSGENAPEPESTPLRTIDLNQIELQITSKLAMAENENNLNIEYSGPLTVEGLIEEGGAIRESDAVPELYLAGNGGSVEDVREELSLDEECVKALRNELELKLPLAQVAAIEPQCEGEAEWQGELPPPPELVVSYPGALSPIQEETGQQLSAYENDTNWNPSTRTDSSESYPEPCNNSTDSATELPCRDTYTVRDARPPAATVLPDTSKELSMSADSLNASPHKSNKEPSETPSPIDDRTYTKEERVESNCERISQVSPYLVSPTTDTEPGDATRASSLSRTSQPSDGKPSKPSDTHCLSKATSIDSWCSNDTLYNVEENFDDLAMDPDLPRYEKEPTSDSTDTLTHNDERELSPCSTYIIHESASERSEPNDTFSPDSITANDNCTYTKARPEPAATPSGTEGGGSTPTRDLAYGTLLSGMPSFSACSTERVSALEDAWRQPELVRRSPAGDRAPSPPRLASPRACEDAAPRLADEPRLGRMDSVEITCLRDSLNDPANASDTDIENLVMVRDSPNYTDIAPSLTSTPLVEPDVGADNVEPIALTLPQCTAVNSDYCENVPNFRSFQRLAEDRPQDISSKAGDRSADDKSEALLDGETKNLSNFLDFELSAMDRPQNTNSREKSSQSMESGISSSEFHCFEDSAKCRPQDLSSLIGASSLLLKSERMSSELAMSSSTGRRGQASQSDSGSNEPMLSSNEPMQSSNDRMLFSNEPMQSSNDNILFTGEPMQSSNENMLSSTELMQPVDVSPPSITNLVESHELVDTRELPPSAFLINFDMEDETEQPHSIIFTEVPINSSRISPNRTNDSHVVADLADLNHTYESNENNSKISDVKSLRFYQPEVNGETLDQPESLIVIEQKSPIIEDQTIANHIITTENIADEIKQIQSNDVTGDKVLSESESKYNLPNGSTEVPKPAVIKNVPKEIHLNGGSEKFATVNFLNETFEELIESSVDDGDSRDDKLVIDESPTHETTTEISSEKASELEEKVASSIEDRSRETSKESLPRSSTDSQDAKTNGVVDAEGKMTAVTEDFLQNEKKYATMDSYFPLLSDIRFTGPASEMMSTSFQESPTSPTSPECEQDSKPDTAAEILKEWDSDSDSHSSNSSSGEFIWKDGDGHETSVVPTTHFEHQRGSGGPTSAGSEGPRDGSNGSDGSDGSGSGSEGDEVEFVPSSWDCRAEPSKSSLRSLEQATPESKKRVVFKRQKYHCVYEYPREAPDAAPHSPAYLPDLSTYCEWDPTSAEEAELCYGQLFSSPSALGVGYPLRGGIAFGSDYDEDFFISSSARPFESLGIMSTTSQFFPGGMHAKRSLLERSPPEEEFPAPPPPLPTTTAATPSLDFTTPDSGVEDITPGSIIDDDLKVSKPEAEPVWRALDSGSSSESASPSSPGGGGGGEALGGLRHTRDRLKLDLPPSPHAPSPRHARVFSFVLEKPRRRDEPLVMSDDTPPAAAPPPPLAPGAPPPPEPTFSTFGKGAPRPEPEQKIILTDEDADPEGVRGEGTVLDSGDEDSGIESSSKATLERKAPNVS